MKNDRKINDQEKAIDNVLHDVQHLVERTERFISTGAMSVNELRESAARMAEMRALLGDLVTYSARNSRMTASGSIQHANGTYLAKRCLDLEGRIKEKRNDLLHSGAGPESKDGGMNGRPEDIMKTILVVEDDADVRMMVRSVLKEYGYNVLEASNGSQAMDIFVRHQAAINLSLIDIFLPGKNGKELSDDMRSVRPDAKVLFTSGYSADLLSTQDLKRPDTGFIAKPTSPEDLVRKIEGLLKPRTTA